MEANEDLIAARVAQPSRSRPRQPLSRKELAELINRYVWDHHRQQTPVDENYIESSSGGSCAGQAPSIGRPSWPSSVLPTRRPGLCTVSVLKWQPRGNGRKMSSSPMSIVAASTRLLDVMAPTPWPAQVGAPEIDQIWQAARAFSVWDNLYGGLAREAPVAQLRWSAGLIQGASCPAERRPDLSRRSAISPTPAASWLLTATHSTMRGGYLASASSAQKRPTTGTSALDCWLPECGWTLGRRPGRRADARSDGACPIGAVDGH